MTLKNLIAEAHSIIPKISCDEFTMNANDYLIIDVREGTEIAETGAIPNAINIPRGLIEMKLSPSNEGKSLNGWGASLPKILASYNADTTIVVYCGGSSRASLAGKTLKDLGFKNIYNLEGGYRGWKDSSN